MPMLLYLGEGESSFFETYLPALAKGIGGVLLVAPFATYALLSALEVSNLALHVGIASPFIAAMIYGGYWLDRGTLPTHRWPRIGRWFLGGLLAFLGLNVVMMVLMEGVVPYELYPFWGYFASDAGGTVGLAIGILEARAIEHEIAAERSRIRHQEAEQRNRQLEDFAKIVSHDLRNPLNVATGRLQLARDEWDSDHLAAVEGALARIDEIIEDVLMLTWSGQGIDPEDFGELRLGELAEASWEHVDTADARLQIENEPTVQGNEQRLQRLLENLFRNAVEHGGEEVTVRVGTLAEGFFVEDDGPGIPRENREKVFEAGYSSNEEGTGLGLSIVRTIAEAHGWDVSATEGREGGVRFEFVALNGERMDPQSNPSPVKAH